MTITSGFPKRLRMTADRPQKRRRSVFLFGYLILSFFEGRSIRLELLPQTITAYSLALHEIEKNQNNADEKNRKTQRQRKRMPDKPYFFRLTRVVTNFDL